MGRVARIKHLAELILIGRKLLSLCCVTWWLEQFPRPLSLNHGPNTGLKPNHWRHH